MTDKEIIKQYLDFKGVSKNKFYKKTGLSSSFLDRGDSLGVDKLRLIVDNYPDFNFNLLITGKGAMICEPAQKPAIIEDLEKELQGLKDKYYKLMEENHDLLVELRALESKNSKPQKAS